MADRSTWGATDGGAHAPKCGRATEEPHFPATKSIWHETGKSDRVPARFSKAILTVSVVATALSGAACRKSSEEQQREAQKATEEAEQKASQVSQTTITSGELGASEDLTEEAREARERALREQAEAITTARNEQLEYRGDLQSALDRLDKKRREAKKRGPSYVKAIDARREVLKHDLDALDRTTDGEWASLKAKIDRDLKDHAGAGEAEGK